MNFKPIVFAMAILAMTDEIRGQSPPEFVVTYDLTWNTIDCGGGDSNGGPYSIDCTIGQPDASATVMTGGTFSMSGGFRSGGGHLNNCPADVEPAGGNGLVNVDDLLAIINQWGACISPPVGCTGDIEPPGGNGIVNVDDLLKIITSWGLCPP